MPTKPFFWASQANAPIDSLPSFDDAAEANKNTLRPAVNRSRRNAGVSVGGMKLALLWKAAEAAETAETADHQPVSRCANTFTMRMPVD